MISINSIVFSNDMIFEVYRSHPWRHGYPPDIRPPEIRFCRLGFGLRCRFKIIQSKAPICFCRLQVNNLPRISLISFLRSPTIYGPWRSPTTRALRAFGFKQGEQWREIVIYSIQLNQIIIYFFIIKFIIITY